MIDWIARSKRVPDNRRLVWVWGIGLPSMPLLPIKPRYLGSTRFNLDKSGGVFDVETIRHSFFSFRVTHWAEIEGPAEEVPIIPQPQGVTKA